MALSSNYTESTRTLNSSFILNEQELRRTIEVVNEQFDKKGLSNPVFKFTVKHFNGLVADTQILDDIFKIENIGSYQIVSLHIVATSTTISDYNISIHFSNKFSENEYGDYTVKYNVRGIERDWVMISSSLIEDRLNKITSTSFISKISSRLFLSILSLAMIGLFSTLLFSMGKVGDYQNKTQLVINDLDKKYLKKENIDIIKAIIDIEKSKLSKDTKSIFDGPFKTIIWLIMPLMLLITFSDFIKKKYLKYFPICVFYWGDFIEKYDRMKKNKNLLLGFIFITIFVSIFVNLFSNFLWEKFYK